MLRNFLENVLIALLFCLLLAGLFVLIGLAGYHSSATEQIGPAHTSCPDPLWWSMNGCQPPPMVDRDAYGAADYSLSVPGLPRHE